MLLVDYQIKDYVEKYKMIDPFVDHQVKDGISYGLGSAGYDIRIAGEWKFPPRRSVLDPKNLKGDEWWSITIEPPFELGANSFVLGRSIEYINLPRNIMAIVLTKSTYARVGVFANITPIESQWKGNLTIEIANLGHTPVLIYPNEGIAQVLFFKTDMLCDVSYADRKGKYQGQTGVTLAKV